jgi:hypothetical protein
VCHQGDEFLARLFRSNRGRFRRLPRLVFSFQGRRQFLDFFFQVFH